jgi:hypothetical protein
VITNRASSCIVGHSETIVRWQRGRIDRLFVEVNLNAAAWLDAIFTKKHSVTAEVASSSLVVPAILSNAFKKIVVFVAKLRNVPSVPSFPVFKSPWIGCYCCAGVCASRINLRRCPNTALFSLAEPRLVISVIVFASFAGGSLSVRCTITMSRVGMIKI